MARLPELRRLVRLADDVRGHRRGREELLIPTGKGREQMIRLHTPQGHRCEREELHLIGPHGRPLVLVSVWLVRLRNALRLDLEALAPKRGAQTWNADCGRASGEKNAPQEKPAACR